MKKMNAILALAFIFFVLDSPAAGRTDLPAKPESWVSDFANVLTAPEKALLNDRLQDLEKRSSNQIYIALFDHLPQDYYLEDFAVKLFEKWRPGLKKQDNGLLIVVFVQDRKIRIEVGYGLEDVITDAQAATIIRQVITPEFARENFFAGLRSALDKIIPAVEGKYIIPVKEQGANEVPVILIIAILLVLFVAVRFFSGNSPKGIGSRKRGGYSAGTFLSGGFGQSSSGGGGFSGGFGGLSGGGGASGGW